MIELDQGGDSYGQRQLVAPPADLVPVIEYAWIHRRDCAPAPTDRHWRIVPDPSGHLIYSASGNATPRLCLVGARSRWVDIDVSARDVTVGIRFRPGAIGQGVRTGGVTMTDRSVALAEIRTGSNLVDRAANAVSDRDRVAMLFHEVRQWNWAVASDWRTRAVVAMAHAGETRIGEMVDATGVSPRTLRDVARRDIGLSPKRMARIVRLARTMRAALGSPSTSWGELAAHAGFSDQAHLIRDSRALLGQSPARFLARSD